MAADLPSHEKVNRGRPLVLLEGVSDWWRPRRPLDPLQRRRFYGLEPNAGHRDGAVKWQPQIVRITLVGATRGLP